MLEPHELDDEYFMLRVRVDGGPLNLTQLRTLARCRPGSPETPPTSPTGRTSTHWIRIEDVPEVWRELEAVGLPTTEACGDTPRVVLGSPVAGISADEVIDATPAIREIVDTYIGDPTILSNLPRKFQTVVSWLPDVPYEANDISFIGVEHPEHGPGFDLWVGGGLSTNPMLAKRLGAWIPLAEVPDVWAGVVRVFRDYGYRRLRSRARLKFLVADWGVEKFRQVLEDEYLGRKLIDGPAPKLPRHADRPHWSPQAERRAELRWRGGRCPGRCQRHAAHPGRRHRGSARSGPGADNAIPEASGARCGRRPGGVAGYRSV